MFRDHHRAARKRDRDRGAQSDFLRGDRGDPERQKRIVAILQRDQTVEARLFGFSRSFRYSAQVFLR
jgi:hypothetical protein